LVAPHFTLSVDNGRAVAAICCCLDGLPLAIELAAARLADLTCAELERQLTQRFRLLIAGNRAALPRQQTLAAVTDWIYQLLSAPEQVLLRWLSVFGGGWTPAAAEQVGADLDQGAASVQDVQAGLMEKSLVEVDAVRTAQGETRYRLLETVRAYAQYRLADLPAARNRLLAWCLHYAWQGNPREDPDDERIARLEAEHDNFRLALDRPVERGALEEALKLVLGLDRVWYWRGYSHESTDRVLAAARERGAAAGPQVLASRCEALVLASTLAYKWGHLDRGMTLLQESLALVRASPTIEKSTMARLLNMQALFLCEQGASEPALDLLQESLILARETGDALGMMRARRNQGWALHSAGRYQEALAAYEESIGLANLHNGPMIVAQVLGNRAHTLYALGKDAQALVPFKQVLQTARDIGVHWGSGVWRDWAAWQPGTRVRGRPCTGGERPRPSANACRPSWPGGIARRLGRTSRKAMPGRRSETSSSGTCGVRGSNSASRRRWRRR
jgi:tetratricopeptide (TPR) repeat protein